MSLWPAGGTLQQDTPAAQGAAAPLVGEIFKEQHEIFRMLWKH
jgi:hypothetical protein